MTTTQFDTYAKFYDLLYRDKNYKGEARFIDSLISGVLPGSKKLQLLDLACGTGRHLIELSELGYEHLTGSDIASNMIDIARSNVKKENKKIEFHNFSFQNASKIKGAYDIVISMFSAINYLTTYNDQLTSLKNIHGLLNPKGLFIFDFWNGNAVSRDYSPIRVVHKKDGNNELIRVSETTLNRISQDAHVHFKCLFFENGHKQYEFEEMHHLHYYYCSEILNLLSQAGFIVRKMIPFMEPDKALDAYDWNITIVAEKA